MNRNGQGPPPLPRRAPPPVKPDAPLPSLPSPPSEPSLAQPHGGSSASVSEVHALRAYGSSPVHHRGGEAWIVAVAFTAVAVLSGIWAAWHGVQETAARETLEARLASNEVALAALRAQVERDERLINGIGEFVPGFGYNMTGWRVHSSLASRVTRLDVRGYHDESTGGGRFEVNLEYRSGPSRPPGSGCPNAYRAVLHFQDGTNEEHPVGGCRFSVYTVRNPGHVEYLEIRR